MNAQGGNAQAVREQAEALAASLPPLLVAAERLASSVSLGVHGRRKAGMGETFWQFRRYQPEDAATTIDWRQSAKSQHLFVREREWEAAEAVWFWRDGAPGMRFKSEWAEASKIDRATVLTLALGALLIRGGERIALLGDGHGPGSGRPPLRRIAHELIDFAPGDDPLPPEAPVTRNAQFVWFSDFLSPLDEHRGRDEAAGPCRAFRPSRPHHRSGRRGFSVSGTHTLRSRRPARTRNPGPRRDGARGLSGALQGA